MDQDTSAISMSTRDPPRGPSMAQVIERRTYGLHNGELLHEDHMEDDKAGFKLF